MPITIKLTHHYSRNAANFFAIRTDWDIEAINLACAYIQLKREELPSTIYFDDVIGEPEAFTLLHEMYGFEQIKTPCLYDETIDLHENWTRFACFVPNNVLNKFAVPNASLIILKYMLKEVELFQPFINDIDPRCSKEYWAEYRSRLLDVINGKPLKTSWGWQRLDGSFIENIVYSVSDKIELLQENNDHTEIM